MNMRIPYREAHRAALNHMVMLDGMVERIEVVGSLRRGSEDCKDIDLLCIPYGPRDMFVEDLKARGYELLGTEYEDMDEWKQIVTVRDPYLACAVDIFITSRRFWGAASLIWTGPRGFGQTVAGLAGLKYDQVPQKCEWETEFQAFQELGIKYVPAYLRTNGWKPVYVH